MAFLISECVLCSLSSSLSCSTSSLPRQHTTHHLHAAAQGRPLAEQAYRASSLDPGSQNSAMAVNDQLAFCGGQNNDADQTTGQSPNTAAISSKTSPEPSCSFAKRRDEPLEPALPSSDDDYLTAEELGLLAARRSAAHPLAPLQIPAPCASRDSSPRSEPSAESVCSGCSDPELGLTEHGYHHHRSRRGDSSPDSGAHSATSSPSISPPISEVGRSSLRKRFNDYRYSTRQRRIRRVFWTIVFFFGLVMAVYAIYSLIEYTASMSATSATGSSSSSVPLVANSSVVLDCTSDPDSCQSIINYSNGTNQQTPLPLNGTAVFIDTKDSACTMPEILCKLWSALSGS